MTDAARVVLRLGNGDETTTVELPVNWSTMECYQSVTLPDGVVDHHYDDDSTPDWVACSGLPVLAGLLAEHYGCEDRT